MENIQVVKDFLTSEEPKKFLMVDAYCVRDEFMGLDNYENRIKHMKKLGYDLEVINNLKSNSQEKFINNEMKRLYGEYINNNVDVIINISELIEMYENSEEYVKMCDRIDFKINRYNFLKDKLETNMYDFYNNLTEEELIYLGW